MLQYRVDTYTFVISIIGIILAIIYIRLLQNSSRKQTSEEKELKEEGKELFVLREACKTHLKSNSLKLEDKDKLGILLKDYEISNKEIERRENITLLIGSILITSSILLLIYGKSNFRWKFALASISIYSLWLFLVHFLTKKLDDLSYSRIRTIEEALKEMAGYDFGIHSYLRRKIQKTCWIKLRRSFWGFLLIFLSLTWLSLSCLS